MSFTPSSTSWCPVIDRIQAEVDGLEEEVLRKSLARREFDHLYRLRRDLLRLRRAVGPVIDVCKRLEHADLFAMDNEMKPLFRDVLDHARRAEEDIDSLREILAFVFEASMRRARRSRPTLRAGWRLGWRSSRCQRRWLESTA
jgi:Mg2+ and Co2+ transporter CorA